MRRLLLLPLLVAAEPEVDAKNGWINRFANANVKPGEFGKVTSWTAPDVPTVQPTAQPTAVPTNQPTATPTNPIPHRPVTGRPTICGMGQVFDLQGFVCTATCDDPVPPGCADSRTAKCQCPRERPFWDEEGGECIKTSDCPDGSVYRGKRGGKTLWNGGGENADRNTTFNPTVLRDAMVIGTKGKISPKFFGQHFETHDRPRDAAAEKASSLKSSVDSYLWSLNHPQGERQRPVLAAAPTAAPTYPNCPEGKYMIKTFESGVAMATGRCHDIPTELETAPAELEAAPTHRTTRVRIVKKAHRAALKEPCVSGEYQFSNSAGHKFCLSCRPGKFEHHGTCHQCPVGKYQPAPRSISCLVKKLAVSEVEYVVVGAGSAGCLIASRLAGVPGTHRTAVVEVGQHYAGVGAKLPGAAFLAGGQPRPAGPSSAQAQQSPATTQMKQVLSQQLAAATEVQDWGEVKMLNAQIAASEVHSGESGYDKFNALIRDYGKLQAPHHHRCPFPLSSWC